MAGRGGGAAVSCPGLHRHPVPGDLLPAAMVTVAERTLIGVDLGCPNAEHPQQLHQMAEVLVQIYRTAVLVAKGRASLCAQGHLLPT